MSDDMGYALRETRQELRRVFSLKRTQPKILEAKNAKEAVKVRILTDPSDKHRARRSTQMLQLSSHIGTLMASPKRSLTYRYS